MKQSAGLLVFRRTDKSVEVLLVHPGGPIWGKKDFWSIPKGELDDTENHLEAARREFEEEVGVKPPNGKTIELGSQPQAGGIRQSGGKTNSIWAVEGEVDLSQFSCNNFTMEWPPKSGKLREFPENDRADWFELAAAKQKLFSGQVVFIDRLAEYLQVELPAEPEQQALI